jgi:hypothetical protein
MSKKVTINIKSIINKLVIVNDNAEETADAVAEQVSVALMRTIVNAVDESKPEAVDESRSEADKKKQGSKSMVD